MRNIYLSYFLAFAKNSWFWLGIWVFYYLRFTNYAGIGIIETVLIVTYTLTEIPTGAVADLLGKKKTLIIAFFLEAVGSFIMATATNFNHLILSVFIMCIGGAFYSGTLEALVFDSLKERGGEKIYDKKISNLNSIALLAPALCGALGGFLYKINPTYPFYANSYGYLLGFFASFFLIEPKIDTEKFSLNNFFKQTTYGMRELFKNAEVKRQTLFLLTIGVFVIISSEMLDSFLGVEFGLGEQYMGILWGIIYIVSALASQLTPVLNTVFTQSTTAVVGILMGVTFVVSPFVGVLIGGLSIIMRSSLQGIFSSLASITINQSTESKFRATTLSTFNMLKNIPYVLMAYFLGLTSDTFSAKTASFYLGALLLVLIPLQLNAKFNAVKKRSG